MAEEVSLLLAIAPELDGVRQRVHCLAVAADEGTAKVDVLEAVILRLEVCDLTNVVAAGCQVTSGNAFVEEVRLT